MVMGTVIAWVLVRDRFWGKRALDVIIDIPFALPTIVAGLVLLSLYGTESPLGVDVANTRKAVFLAIAFVTLPFVVRTVQPVLEEMERDVEEAAASLGATPADDVPSRHPARPWCRRSSPAPRCPSRAASASTARWCCSAATCPDRTEVTSVRVLTYLEGGNTAGAAAVATVMLVVALLAIVTLDIDPEAGEPPWLSTSTSSAIRVKWLLRVVVVAYLFLLVAWPSALVVQRTFENGLDGLRTALSDPDVTHALWLTVQVALIAVVINLVFGVGISLLLVRTAFPGKRLLSALIDVPLAVSPVVVGLALVLVYNGRFGWFGPTLEANGLQVIFATPGMIMATCFVALPLVVREVVPVLEEIGDDQEQAARCLGANARADLPPDHAARASSGPSCTASCSAWPAPSASSAPSRWSPATSPARPSWPRSWSSRSTRTSSRRRRTPSPSSSRRPRCSASSWCRCCVPRRTHEHRGQRHHQAVRRTSSRSTTSP